MATNVAKINFLGDIGLFRKYEKLKINPFQLINLPKADLTIGNFEFMISENSKKEFFDVQDNYSCSWGYLKNLEINNFQGFGLANNHAMDYGIKGAKNTINLLQGKQIRTFGFSSNRDYNLGFFTINDIRIGIIAVVKNGRWSKSNFGYGPDEYNEKKITEIINQNASKFDHIIVYPHWGTELIDIPNKQDVMNARKFIDAGATAVVGHHPHVSQGIETYKDGVIAYSLGSFIYCHEEELGYSSKNEEREISICLTLELNETKITDYLPTYYRYNNKIFLPQKVDDTSLNSYIEFINSNIHNQAEYQKRMLNILLKREIFCFFQRLKTNPIKTIIYYLKFIKFRHLKKFFTK